MSVCCRLRRSTVRHRDGAGEASTVVVAVGAEVRSGPAVVVGPCGGGGGGAGLRGGGGAAGEEEAAAVHEAAAGRVGARLRGEHVHHQAAALGTVAAARADRATGEDLVSEPAHEGQEADAAARTTTPAVRRRRCTTACHPPITRSLRSTQLPADASGGYTLGPDGGTGSPPQIVARTPNLAVLLIHCGQLILRKISKFDATRCHRPILRLKCTKFDFRWGSAPDPAGQSRP